MKFVIPSLLTLVLVSTLFLSLIFFLLGGIVPLSYVDAQGHQMFSVYENPNFRLRFQYPSNWTIYNYPPDLARGGNVVGAITTFKEDPAISTTSYPRFALYVITQNDIGRWPNQTITSMPANTTLIEYLKTYYDYDHYRLTFSVPVESIISQERIDYTLINDNHTTIGNGYDAWQIVSTAKARDHRDQGTEHVIRELDVYTMNGGVIYHFEYAADPGPKFFENLPAVREVLDSIKFLPPPQPKLPSFSQ
jgi:hypothetical protein